MKRERAGPYATIALEHPRTMRLICARATRASSESILTEDVAARMRGLIASPGTVPLLMTPVIADYHLPDGTARPIADRGRFSLGVYPRARLCRGRENLAIDLPTRGHRFKARLNALGFSGIRISEKFEITCNACNASSIRTRSFDLAMEWSFALLERVSNYYTANIQSRTMLLSRITRPA